MEQKIETVGDFLEALWTARQAEGDAGPPSPWSEGPAGKHGGRLGRVDGIGPIGFVAGGTGKEGAEGTDGEWAAGERLGMEETVTEEIIMAGEDPQHAAQERIRARMIEILGVGVG